jgi:protein-S-isoprenylcysteine O-methyltransferase Ste14
MKQASIFAHLRDILLLPVTVTCIVPYLIYNSERKIMADMMIVKIAGLVILISGLALFLRTVFLFRTIAKGTLAPWSEKQKLVVTGPYRYCRNPMITGVLFILIGESFLFNSVNIILWALTFFIINTIYFIVSEEPALKRRFGEDYERYKQQVPRWIPKLTAYK